MINETIRMVTDALSTGSYGVNYQLPLLTLDAGDTAAPLIVSIADETRSDAVAVGRYPTTLPALTVTLEGNPTLQGDVVSGTRDGEVTLLIRYITSNTDSAVANRMTYDTIRAVLKTLKEFNSNAQSDSRTRNNVQVIECLRMELVQSFNQIDDASETASVRVTFRVRDVTP